MNIHEYQAKAVLREFGVPVSRGIPVLARRRCGVGGRGARRPGLGREIANSRGRARQGQVQGAGGRQQGGRPNRQIRGRGRDLHRAKCSAGPLSPRKPARPASRSTGFISRKAPRSSRNSIFPCWSIVRQAGSLSLFRPKAAWISRRWRIIRPRRITSFTVDPATGIMPHHGRTVAKALGLVGRSRQTGGKTHRAALYGVRRQGYGLARNQSADRFGGRATQMPRRQNLV